MKQTVINVIKLILCFILTGIAYYFISGSSLSLEMKALISAVLMIAGIIVAVIEVSTQKRKVIRPLKVKYDNDSVPVYVFDNEKDLIYINKAAAKLRDEYDLNLGKYLAFCLSIDGNEALVNASDELHAALDKYANEVIRRIRHDQSENPSPDESDLSLKFYSRIDEKQDCIVVKVNLVK